MNDLDRKVILLVEDERITSKTITRILEKHGYFVLHASSGNEAVALAENCKKLDLLLTDIDLGYGMDGTAAAQIILKNKNIPALFLSSHTEPEVVEKTEKITSYGYVVKNSGETVLITSLKMAFKLFEAHEKINAQRLELEATAEKMQISLDELEASNEGLISTQKLLIESEGKYRRLHESMTDAYAMVDLYGRIVESNKAFQKLTGYTAKELTELTYIELTPEKWRESEKNIVIETIRSKGNTPIYEKEYIRKDGSIVPVELRIFVLPDEQNRQIAIWAIVRDITERKNAYKTIEERESKFRTIFENAPYSIVINRLSDGTYIDVNRKFRELTGLEFNCIYGKKPDEILHIVDPLETINMMNVFKENGFVENFQYKTRNSKGIIINNLISIYPLKINNEECIISIAANITELKEAEKRAMINEKLTAQANYMLQLVLDTIPARIFWKDVNFKYLGCNRLVAMDAGLSSPHQLIGLDDFDMPWKDQAELYRVDDLKIINTGISKINYEEMLKRADGTILWLNTSKVPLRDVDGQIIGILGTWEDITEKKKAKELLNIGEERFRSIIQSSSDMIFIIDDSNKITYESPSVPGILGYNKDHFIGLSPFLLIHPDDLELVQYEMKLVMNSINDGQPTEFRIKKADNSWVCLEAIATNLLTNPAVNGIVITARDISERKKAEEAIYLSEEKFRNIFESMTIGYFRTSMNGNILDLNPACLRLFGYNSMPEAREILQNNSINVYSDPEEWIHIRNNITAESNPRLYTMRFVRKDKSEFTGSLNLRIVYSAEGKPLHIEGLIEDISERIRTQELLIQSEKMVTIAGLAAGMAHEINNPLGIIMQNAENAKNRLFGELPGNIDAAVESGTNIETIRKYASARRINNYLDEIHEAGSRAAKIINNILQFSRGTDSKLSYINVNNLIDKAIDLARNDYDLKKKYDFKNILITRTYGSLPEIQCNETQIEQAFLNIIKNAAQALNQKIFNEGVSPEIMITTFSQDGSVRIEISDNGPGMDTQIKKRIFEPFFTTKEPGKGTGLGLSVSFYIIVNGHGGTISAESIQGKGSKFVISLPEDVNKSIL